MEVNATTRVTKISPIVRTLNIIEKPKDPLLPIRDEIILQTPEQRANQLITLSFRVGSNPQRREWLGQIGITDIPDENLQQIYIQNLNEQKQIAGHQQPY